MNKLNYRTRRRRQTQRKKPALTLTVEALEPRLVLSAAGFGFEAAGERLDFHARDHGNHEADHAAFAGQIHGKVGNRQFAWPDPRMDRQGMNPNHFESSPPKSGPAGQARGGRPIEPLAAIPCEFAPCGPRMDHPPGKPLDDTDIAEGESTFSTDYFDDFSSRESVDDALAPTMQTGITIPSTAVIFISLPPASSPSHGDELLNVGQPATRIAQPPRTSTVNSVSQPSSSAATLPVVVSVSSPTSTRVPSTTPRVESSIVRFDSGSTQGDALPAQPASDFKNIVVPDIATFVSLSQSDSASGWDLDGESIAAAIGSVNQSSDSDLPTIVNERATASSIDSMRDRVTGLSEASLWAALSDGGFIEIKTDAEDSSHERFDSAEDSEGVSASKRLSTETPRDAFWFDFGDSRLDLIFDSDALAELAAEQTLDIADDADEEAWLRDDGGMIVLASSQFIDQAVEAAVDDASGSSSIGEAEAGETDIPMDAGIGVFQAIEVAAAPVEQQDALQTADGTAEPIEGEATADADDAVPVVEQAAKNSESGPPEPIRAASLPLLLAIATFLSGGHQRRKKIADRRRKA